VAQGILDFCTNFGLVSYLRWSLRWFGFDLQGSGSAREGIDDWDKASSLAVGAIPRRSTSSLAELGLDMQLLGTIEPGHVASGDVSAWITLIRAHPSLALAPPQQGFNPFTKQPHSFKPASDSASVLVDGTNVGTIHSAMDGSRRLVVWSVATKRTQVTNIAQDVASRLGWRLAFATDA
jgi:hypothetical protein